ncbi:TSUP family transporter [Comamonas testosteroni]|uniref:TSUP family transporter n=1 Tax=Comamonas testosteroni TaxID=285 RepID=UPI00389A0F66
MTSIASSGIHVHVLFTAFVGLAVYAQNLTGFALALVLLGLVGLTDLIPLTDATNAVTILTMSNACLFLYKRRPLSIQPAMKPAVIASIIGSLAGMGILTFLAANATNVLRILLGLCVIGCAMLLWKSAEPYEQPSGTKTFTCVGAISGLLGGMFATPGPPLVYAVYRQPWPMNTIQESLIFSFGVGAALRLSVMTATGQISRLAIQLALEALPVLFVVTVYAANRRPPVSKEMLQRIVCVLLICAGVGILV